MPTTRSQRRIEGPVRKLGLPDPLLDRRNAKARSLGYCSMFTTKSRSKVLRKDKALYRDKNRYCALKSRGKKPICQCPVKKWDPNTGKYKVVRRPTCRKRPKRRPKKVKKVRRNRRRAVALP